VPLLLEILINLLKKPECIFWFFLLQIIIDMT